MSKLIRNQFGQLVRVSDAQYQAIIQAQFVRNRMQASAYAQAAQNSRLARLAKKGR